MEKKNGQYVGVDDKYIPEEEKYVDNATNSEIKDTVNSGLNAANDYIKDKDNQEKIKNAGKKGLKIAKGVGIGYLVYVGIVLVIAIVVMAFIFFFKGFSQFDKVSDKTNEIIDKASDNVDAGYDKFELAEFNNDLEVYSGTQYGSRISYLLDNVVTKIKKDSNHSISVVYGDVTTSNPNEIINLKSQFDRMTEYEVTFDYDADSYINKVTILNK